MSKRSLLWRPLVQALCCLGLAASSAAWAQDHARIVITNGDDPGVGFNDPTPVDPVGGNPGTTLGAQRLFVYQHVAHAWARMLPPGPPIEVYAYWDALTCTDTTAVLGAAGAYTVTRDFAGAPLPATWYSAALANTRAGTDLDGGLYRAGQGWPEIIARFNVNLGQSGCLAGSPFYLGVDRLGPVGQTDFATVLRHELAHGLGFQAFTNGATGERIADTSGETYPSQWEHLMLDVAQAKTWRDMSNTERMASAISGRNLVWNGPQVLAAVPEVLAKGTPVMSVRSKSAPTLAGAYQVGEAAFGPGLASGAVHGQVARVIDTPATGAGLACTPLDAANAAAVAGRIALIDRGSCAFTVKVKNVQDAGAVAALVADHTAGSPPGGMSGVDPTVTIPSVRITLDDGNKLKTVLTGVGTAGVSATLKVDRTLLAGADSSGRPYLYAPNPLQPGSSISHWDTLASPNLLMEPFINVDLGRKVKPPRDLTLPLLKDIGW